MYVTREEENGMCTGIVNDKYCEFPNSILQEEDEVYVSIILTVHVHVQ